MSTVTLTRVVTHTKNYISIYEDIKLYVYVFVQQGLLFGRVAP